MKCRLVKLYFPQEIVIVALSVSSSSSVRKGSAMDSESDSEPEYKLGSRGKGKATEQKEIKRRSSKACTYHRPLSIGIHSLQCADHYAVSLSL